MSSWFFLLSPRLGYILEFAGPEKAKNLAGKSPPPDSDPFSERNFAQNRA
jgi:hypothetical protein